MTPAGDGNRDDGGGSSTTATTFSLRRVQAMLGLSRSVVAGLIEQGFVTPTRGKRNELRFTFQDLMLLRTAHALQASKIRRGASCGRSRACARRCRANCR